MDNFFYNLAVGAPGFLLGIVCHEMGHAYMAMRFGDDTARRSGRLTFNPLAHIDMLGTVILPLIGAIAGFTMFGWAKPVPVDPRNFKNYRKAIFWVSFSGPGINLALGTLAAFFMAVVVTQVPQDFFFFEPFIAMLKSTVLINYVLAVFNLIPFPPLDGSRMVASFMGYNTMRKYESLQKYSFLFILVLWFTPILRYLLTPALLVAQSLIFYFVQILA